MARNPEPAPVSTPCIRLCTLDPASGLCLGCGRSLDEIGRWGAIDEPSRRRIMTELPGRLAALAGDRVPDAAAP